MCGILFILSFVKEKRQCIEEKLLPLLNRRGPSSNGCHAVVNENFQLIFHASVLHLRGSAVTKQPLLSANGSALLWNGEVFGGSLEVENDTNDTRALLCALEKCSTDSEVVHLMSCIHGPWAMMYYQAYQQKLWYGRDMFGRRSLVTSYNDGTLVVSSVGEKSFENAFTEVPASELHCIQLSNVDEKNIQNNILTLTLLTPDIAPLRHCEHRCVNSISKQSVGEGEINPLRSSGKGDSSPRCCSDENDESEVTSIHSIQQEFLSKLKASVHKRVYNLPRGESDKPCVGILFSGGVDSVILAALTDHCLPGNEPVDLINVAFQQKPKVLQGIKKKDQRVGMLPDEERFNVPDRLSAKEALKDLSACGGRTWNFIEVNVTAEELQEKRQQRIADLVYPLNSVLDDSIGCAIWFAARGSGTRYSVRQNDGEVLFAEENYKSPVKVLLCGMGADEQLGGYSRHRTKFESSGWAGLKEELEMDFSRISTRNLGRDDRCISDHGREARFPFLDINIVSFLRAIPACIKCDPRRPRGYGEKILLREIATMLNQPRCSVLPKRAIQFGSRIAKMEGKKEKGGERCRRL